MASINQWALTLSVSPAAFRTTRPFPSPRERKTIKARMASSFDGIYTGSSFFVILTLALFVFAMLVHFVGYGELGRVLGEGKLERIFFQPLALKASRHGSGVALPRVD